MPLEEATVATELQTQETFTAPTAPINDFMSFVPEEYHSNESVIEISRAEDPHKELWTKFNGMQESLKSQPAGMPSQDSPKEDWERWSTAVAPKDISAYGNIKPTLPEDKAHLQQFMDPVYDKQVVDQVLDTARQLGIQPYQMQGLMNKFNELQLGAADTFFNQNKEQMDNYNKEFDAICSQKFGSNRDRIVREGFDFLAKTDPEMAKRANNLPNEQLADLAALAYSMKQKYGREDSISSVGSTSQPGSGHDSNSLKAAISEKMNEEAYKNTFHPGHHQAVKEMRALSEQLGRLTNPTKGF